MSKQKFIRGIVEIVMSGIPLNFFESRGFLVLNGEMARKLSVSLSRESIRRYVSDAANLATDALITKLKGKLVYKNSNLNSNKIRSSSQPWFVSPTSYSSNYYDYYAVKEVLKFDVTLRSGCKTLLCARFLQYYQLLIKLHLF